MLVVLSYQSLTYQVLEEHFTLYRVLFTSSVEQLRHLVSWHSLLSFSKHLKLVPTLANIYILYSSSIWRTVFTNLSPLCIDDIKELFQKFTVFFRWFVLKQLWCSVAIKQDLFDNKFSCSSLGRTATRTWTGSVSLQPYVVSAHTYTSRVQC